MSAQRAARVDPVERTDPLVMAGAALGVSVIALAAAALPARRAARVDLMTALRAE